MKLKEVKEKCIYKNIETEEKYYVTEVVEYQFMRAKFVRYKPVNDDKIFIETPYKLFVKEFEFYSIAGYDDEIKKEDDGFQM